MEVLITAYTMRQKVEEYQKILAPYGIRVSFLKEGFVYKLNEKDLTGFIAGKFDGIISGDDEWTRAALLAHTPRLKCIVKWGTGVDAIDLEAAADFGIAIYNTPNAFTAAVADHTMAFMGALIRKLPQADQNIAIYDDWLIPEGVTAYHENVLGIIGLGNIGKAVARRALAHDMPVIAFDIDSSAGYPGVKNVDLRFLLMYSDIISLHCDLNATSKYLINKYSLSFMKPTAYLINTARGAIVNQEALIDALDRGTLAGYATDVFEIEPAFCPFANVSADAVVLQSPHMAHSSPAAHENVNRMTLIKLLDGLGVTS